MHRNTFDQRFAYTVYKDLSRLSSFELRLVEKICVKSSDMIRFYPNQGRELSAIGEYILSISALSTYSDKIPCTFS